jgi:phospholipid/cholesterol/gamma-HCH transport system permease protein
MEVAATGAATGGEDNDRGVGPSLHAARRVLLEAASFAQTLGTAVLRLPPVHPGLAVRTAVRYALDAAFFVVVGCATVGGLATFFALRNNPLEGAFTSAVLTGAGKVLIAVLIPLLAGFFFTARIAAGAAARLGTMKRTNQVDALAVMGVRPDDYLLTPLVWGVGLALPVVTASGVVMATASSWLACELVTGLAPYGWARAYFAAIEPEDIRIGLVKTLISGFLVAVQTFHLAMGPKRSGHDVGESVNQAIVSGIFTVLLVHAVFTVVQFA